MTRAERASAGAQQHAAVAIIGAGQHARVVGSVLEAAGLSVAGFAHLAVSHVGAESRVNEGAFLGIGSVVLPRLLVGAWATVGAGAVVMANVRPGTTVIGNPARQTVSDRERADARIDV